jgi:hypothetical protein
MHGGTHSTAPIHVCPIRVPSFVSYPLAPSFRQDKLRNKVVKKDACVYTKLREHSIVVYVA